MLSEIVSNSVANFLHKREKLEMTVLVTGGAGYIGSSIVHALTDASIPVAVVDSFEKGVANKLPTSVKAYKSRIGDYSTYDTIKSDGLEIEAIIHCAAYISVPESQKNPFKYYNNNISEFITMLDGMERIGCKNLVFSSSASIYGTTEGLVDETAPVAPQSIYAQTKWLAEQILVKFALARNINSISLRYFNPIGSDVRGRSGPTELSDGSLLNQLIKAVLNHETFSLTGTDWDTRDGSAIRDYLDINDLAYAHVLATTKLTKSADSGEFRGNTAVNLGTGEGRTVWEVVKAFEAVLGRKLDIKSAPARDGDVAGSYANIDLARSLLGWEPKTGLADSISSHLAWWKSRSEK